MGGLAHAAWAVFAQAQHVLSGRLASVPLLPLPSGTGMPTLALGTGGLQRRKAAEAVEFALRSGYRAIDTAIMYENHRAIAEGLKASGVPRDSVFLISKVSPWMH